MKNGKFIWADLSTYDTGSSTNFYKSVFGWELHNTEGYYLATIDEKSIAGIYETPSFFQKIKMPHFWMSYFQVESTAQAVERAKESVGIIEIENANFYEGNIALIRDPQGAGFTIYDGNQLDFGIADRSACVVSTELQVSDLSEVIPFYTSLFGWDLKRIDAYTYRVNTDHTHQITIRQVDNNTKGKYEYWVTTILVNDLTSTCNLIEKNGGLIISKEENRYMMTDDSQEAFFYIQKKR